MHITTSQTILISLVLLTAGFVWTTFYPAAPYALFSGAVGLVAGINTTKRLLQKQEKYGCAKEAPGAGTD
jgi:hypothetical protein